MKILNLTQHNATLSQVEAGVIEPADKKLVQDLLTFHTLPTHNEVAKKAMGLVEIAQKSGVEYAMIGGAPYLLSKLEASLLSAGITPLYSFTERKSIEVTNADGTVSKTSVFEHVGFVEV